jgi:hypothetical protein
MQTAPDNTPARPVGRPVLGIGLAAGGLLAAVAMVHRVIFPFGLDVIANGAITVVLILGLAVVLAELAKRHHRAAARHGWAYTRRGTGAKAAARGAATRSRPLRAKASSAARHRWAEFCAASRPGPGAPRALPGPEGPSDPQPQPNRQPAPAETERNTAMPVSKIAPDRRARRNAARTGGNVPSEWGPVIAQTADFEPEDDGQLLEWMTRQLTGLSGWAEALVDFYEHCTTVIGIDPKASAMLHDAADAAAQAAETMGAAKTRFTEHYELPREFAANGGLMTHDGRWVTGEGA